MSSSVQLYQQSPKTGGSPWALHTGVPGTDVAGGSPSWDITTRYYHIRTVWCFKCTVCNITISTPSQCLRHFDNLYQESVQQHHNLDISWWAASHLFPAQMMMMTIQAKIFLFDVGVPLNWIHHKPEEWRSTPCDQDAASHGVFDHGCMSVWDKHLCPLLQDHANAMAYCLQIWHKCLQPISEATQSKAEKKEAHVKIWFIVYIWYNSPEGKAWKEKNKEKENYAQGGNRNNPVKKQNRNSWFFFSSNWIEHIASSIKGWPGSLLRIWGSVRKIKTKRKVSISTPKTTDKQEK